MAATSTKSNPPIEYILAHPPGCITVIVADKRIKIWEIATKSWSAAEAYFPSTHLVTELKSFTADRVVTRQTNGDVIIWRIAKKKIRIQKTVRGGHSIATGLEKLFIASETGIFYLYHADNTGIKKPSGVVPNLSIITPSGVVVVHSSQVGLREFETLNEIDAHEIAEVTCMECVGDTLCLGTASGAIESWNTKSDEHVYNVSQEHTTLISGLWSNGEHLWSQGTDHKLVVWEIATLQPLHSVDLLGRCVNLTFCNNYACMHVLKKHLVIMHLETFKKGRVEDTEINGLTSHRGSSVLYCCIKNNLQLITLRDPRDPSSS